MCAMEPDYTKTCTHVCIRMKKSSIYFTGYIYDVTGRPLETVVTFGTMQVFGGIYLISIPFVQRYLRKTSRTENNRSGQL